MSFAAMVGGASGVKFTDERDKKAFTSQGKEKSRWQDDLQGGELGMKITI